MAWKYRLKAETMAWLMEDDTPGVQYVALRDLAGVPMNDANLKRLRRRAHQEGPIATVLSNMEKEGYWVKPGTGYNPKYRSTIWAIILLAQLGASADEDKRIDLACRYLLDHALTEKGQFSMIASGAPSGTADCVQGNLLWSLAEMGYEDARLPKAYEWMARSLTGDGVAPAGDTQAGLRYYAVKSGPGFQCGANKDYPCAWGAVKVMLAFGKLPAEKRTPLIRKAIRQGVDFLFSIDPATAAYPSPYTGNPSRNWWKFGFPVFYITDLLQLAEALAQLNYGKDSRFEKLLEIICSKQDALGRWPLEYDYAGKTWLDFGRKKQPNKWVTWRALRVLRQAGQNSS